MSVFKYCLLPIIPILCASGIFSQNELPRLESPYQAMYVHLHNLQPENFRPYIAAMTIPVADSLEARQLAIQLKQVLDGKGLFVHFNLLPQEVDYLDTLVQKHFYTPFPQQLPEVYLEKTENTWHYSHQTVEAIPALHKAIYPFGTDFLVKQFPEGAKRKFLGLATWQWAGLLLLLIVAWLLQWILSRVFRPVVGRLARSRHSQPIEDKGLLGKVSRLTSILVLLWLTKAALPLLHFPVKANAFLMNGLDMASIVTGVFFGLSIVEVVMLYAYRYAITTDHKLDEQLIPIIRRMLKILIVAGGAIYLLQLLDVNVTALIAGVSIGGLALALAAQDTVKNLIGSAMIFFDKPFQIGDWVVAGGNEGEVIEVGFRSTRIRAVDSSIITVPNNEIAAGAINNMGLRKMRLFRATIGVTYDTPPALLAKFVEGLRLIVEQHPLTKKDNYLVHFNNFGDSSLQLFFRTHLLVGTIAEELKAREEIAFEILRLAAALGVRFAFPTQTLFIEEMPGKGNTTPFYEKNEEVLDKKLKAFFQRT